MQQKSAHICDRGGGCVDAISFQAEKKNCLTVSLIGSTYVCFCQKTVLPVFNLTHFDWLSAHFLSPALPSTPTVHSNSKSNMAGWINNRELIM